MAISFENVSTFKQRSNIIHSYLGSFKMTRYLTFVTDRVLEIKPKNGLTMKNLQLTEVRNDKKS